MKRTKSPYEAIINSVLDGEEESSTLDMTGGQFNLGVEKMRPSDNVYYSQGEGTNTNAKREFGLADLIGLERLLDAAIFKPQGNTGLKYDMTTDQFLNDYYGAVTSGLDE